MSNTIISGTMSKMPNWATSFNVSTTASWLGRSLFQMFAYPFTLVGTVASVAYSSLFGAKKVQTEVAPEAPVEAPEVQEEAPKKENTEGFFSNRAVIAFGVMSALSGVAASQCQGDTFKGATAASAILGLSAASFAINPILSYFSQPKQVEEKQEAVVELEAVETKAPEAPVEKPKMGWGNGVAYTGLGMTAAGYAGLAGTCMGLISPSYRAPLAVLALAGMGIASTGSVFVK